MNLIFLATASNTSPPVQSLSVSLESLLSHNVKPLFVLEYFVDLDDAWMVQFLQDPNFNENSLIFQFREDGPLDDLDCSAEPSLTVFTLPNFTKGTYALQPDLPSPYRLIHL